TYWWKVTEVNGTTQWGSTGLSGVTAPVLWTFTPAAYITIDDFEDYNTTADVNANWMMGYAATCPGSPLITPSGTLTYVLDAAGKHGNFTYSENTSTQQFSEVKRYYGSSGTVFSDSSILSEQPTELRVDYLGAAANAADPVYDVMYVALEDSAGNIGVFNNPDTSASQVTSWTQWYIPLKDIYLASQPNAVNLAAVSAFYLGFGQRCLLPGSQDSGGDGNVMFDNIQLLRGCDWPGGALSEDFDGDCYVDINDLSIFAESWLQKAELRTFTTILAPSAPILWYKFNDSGDTTDVIDYGTGDANNYAGTVANWTSLCWDATDGRAGHPGCLYIPPIPTTGGGPANSQSYVNAPPSAMGFLGDGNHRTNGGGVTVSLWENASLVGDFLVQYPGIWGVWNTANTTETVECPCPSQITRTSATGQAGFYLRTCSIRNAFVAASVYEPILNFGGRWNNWIYVKTPSSMKLYLNGEKVAETDANGQPGDPNAAAAGPLTEAPGAIHIGTRGTNWAMWSGKLQDFQIYDYALSTQEIEYLATDGTGQLLLPITTQANLYLDGGTAGDANQIVNFEDFSVMGSQWHQTQLWP
ncbi:MAG: LamG-like jellyroll fold domain-containing protein, partial [Sedimentisphaerales bacterium]